MLPIDRTTLDTLSICWRPNQLGNEIACAGVIGLGELCRYKFDAGKISDTLFS